MIQSRNPLRNGAVQGFGCSQQVFCNANGVCIDRHIACRCGRCIYVCPACYNCVGSERFTASELYRRPNLSYNWDVQRERRTACYNYEASQCAPQIWKSFCNWDRPFSSSTWSGRLFFCSGNFCICNRSKQGKLVPTRNFLNQIFQIRLQKYLLGFAQTRYSAQNCADCASYPLKALWPTRGWYHPVLSLFAKVFIAFSCNPLKVAYFQIFLLTRLDFCGSLFQQFNITYLLRVPARLPKEPEQVFDFLIAT